MKNFVDSTEETVFKAGQAVKVNPFITSDPDKRAGKIGTVCHYDGDIIYVQFNRSVSRFMSSTLQVEEYVEIPDELAEIALRSEMTQTEFEDAVTELVAEALEIPRGDAQGLVEVQELQVTFCFIQGFSVAETARRVVGDDETPDCSPAG